MTQSNPSDGSSFSPGPRSSGRPNRRRLVMLIVVIFVILASFLAGKYYNRKTYINTTESPAGASQPGNDRQDIPPDSLPH